MSDVTVLATGTDIVYIHKRFVIKLIAYIIHLHVCMHVHCSLAVLCEIFYLHVHFCGKGQT